MRFAVHRPGNPVASPRSHRMPCGGYSWPRSRQRCRRSRRPRSGTGLGSRGCPLRCARTPSSAGSCTPDVSSLPGRGPCLRCGATSRPHPLPRMPRFSPAFCRTLRPGSSAVPRAERVMFLIFRSSTRITSKRRARSVEVFSHQSLRRSASQALSRAMASLDLFAARRSAPRPSQLALQPPPVLPRPRRQVTGQHSSSPVDRARRTRSRPGQRRRLRRCQGPESGQGSRRTRRASGRPGPGRCSPGRISAPCGTGRDQRNRTHPTLGIRTWAVFRFSRRTSPGRIWVMRNPSSATRPSATTGGGASRRRSPPWPGRGPGSPAAARSRCPGPATGSLPWPAESWRHAFREPRHPAAARPPLRFLLHAQGSTHTGRARQVPEHGHCLPAQARAEAEYRDMPTAAVLRRSGTTDSSPP